MKRILASAASILVVLLGVMNATAYGACCPSQSFDDKANTQVAVIEAMYESVDIDRTNMPCHEMDQASGDSDVSCCDCLAASSVAITDAIFHGELTSLGTDAISYYLSFYDFLPEFSSPPPKSIA